MRATTCGLQQRGGIVGRQSLLFQPDGGLLLLRPGHGVRHAAAADGRQQLVRRFGGQHEAHVARRLFQRLEQRVGGDVVHAFGRVDQDRLATVTAAGALGKLHRIAHALDADLLARLALLVVQLLLRLFAQRPVQLVQLGFRHQHEQVGMRAHLHAVAALAVTTGAAIGLRLLAQPGSHQAQSDGVLAQARRPLQQPGMAALLQQVQHLLLQPGRQRAVLWRGDKGRRSRLACTHASQPFSRTACSTCCQTASGVRAASIRAKRSGASLARRA